MNKLTMRQKKWLLSLHLVFTGILLGETVVIVIISLTAHFTIDKEVMQGCYTILNLLARTGIRASIIGTVVTGVLLSVFTHWGMFNYYWILVKEGLTLLSIAIGIVGFYYWSQKGLSIISEGGLNALQNQTFRVNTVQLWIGVGLQVLSLVSMTVISVFKPWGRRKLQ